jgi:hypothetical protein
MVQQQCDGRFSEVCENEMDSGNLIMSISVISWLTF